MKFLGVSGKMQLVPVIINVGADMAVQILWTNESIQMRLASAYIGDDIGKLQIHVKIDK